VGNSPSASPQRGDSQIILGSQLRRARETVRFQLEEAAARLQVNLQDILDWETGRTQPSLSQVEHLAGLYGRDIDYFLRETPEAPIDIEFRSVTPRPFSALSEEARLVVAQFDELCRTALELERLTGAPSPTPIESVSRDLSPVDLARVRRDHLGFGQKPVSKLPEVLTQAGVRVFQLAVPADQFSGLSYWHADYGPCILTNAKELAGRRNFTLAHEYAHLLYRHPPSVCDLRHEGTPSLADVERAADLFAIHFLLPHDVVRGDFSKAGLSSRPSLKDIGQLSGRWGVSVQAMAYRLEELGLISEGYARILLSGYTPAPPPIRGIRRPTWERRLGRQFVSNAILAYREGHISLGKLARSLNLPIRRALDVAEHYAKDR